jgi:hypothetical protein
MTTVEPKVHPTLKRSAFPLTHFKVGQDFVFSNHSCPQEPNASAHLLPEAGTTQERML